MELTAQIHAFLWTAPQANNCNTYLLRTDRKTIPSPPWAIVFILTVDELVTV